jgi:hypothetical protein
MKTVYQRDLTAETTHAVLSGLAPGDIYPEASTNGRFVLTPSKQRHLTPHPHGSWHKTGRCTWRNSGSPAAIATARLKGQRPVLHIRPPHGRRIGGSAPTGIPRAYQAAGTIG